MMLDKPKPITCPCCGQSIAASRVPIEALEVAPISAQQSRIIGILSGAYPRGVSTDLLIDNLYIDDANGGPEMARTTVQVQIHRLRKILPRYGWAIPVNKRGRGGTSVYRLEPLS